MWETSFVEGTVNPEEYRLFSPCYDTGFLP